MSKKKIFFDLEFTGLHKLTTPISIGLVCEDGNKFYAEFTDYDKFQIDNFLRSEVISKLILQDYNFDKDYDPDSTEVYVKGDIDLIYATLNAWLLQYEEDGIEMWGDVLAYDWVLFINSFGNGLALPKFIDYIPMDLSTALKLYGIDKDVNRDEFAYGEEVANSRKDKKHNSLYDAETQLEVYKKMLSISEAKNKDEDEGEIEEEIEEVKTLSTEDVSENIEFPNEDEEEFLEDETFIIDEEEGSKPAKNKKGRGRPKKELNPITSDVNSTNSQFIEPLQRDIDASEEWNPPI